MSRSERFARADGSRRALAAFALLALCLAPAAARAEDDAPKRRPARTYALLIGCDEYPELKKTVPAAIYQSSIRLAGCVNDVALMRKTLMERLGVPAANIAALSGWGADPATRPSGKNVRAALTALAKREYAPGDRVIVHYSGHGVQQPDDDGDEPDGWDEAWLVADAARDPETAFRGTLRDEEIGTYLRAIRDRGATVWCLMDCCHSATGTRAVGDPARVRGLRAETLGWTARPATARGVADRHESSPMVETTHGGASDKGITVFYAAQSYQEVPEVKLPQKGPDRKDYGLLTTTVARALARAGDRMSFGELYEHVVAGYRDLGKHHRVQPMADGDLAASVFGSGRARGTPLVVRKLGPRTLEVSAGALHGLDVGTELDVFAPGHGGEEGASLGRVVVHAVRAESAGVKPVKGTNDAWATQGYGPWPAEVAKFVVGDTSLPLAVVDAQGQPVRRAALPEAVRATLTGREMAVRFPAADALDRARWVLVVDARHRPRALWPTQGGPAAPRFAVDADSLEARLLTVYRGENLLRLAGRDPALGRMPSGLGLRASRRGENGTSTVVRPGARISPGSVLDFGLVKDAGRASAAGSTLDVYVFWIDPHFGISMLYPTEASGPRLGADDAGTADAPIRVGYAQGELTSDQSQGLERIVVFAAPKRADAPHLRLAFLEQPPLEVLRTRGSGDVPADGVSALLGALAFGGESSRGRVKRVDRRTTRLHMQVLTFETTWGPIRVPEPAKGTTPARIQAARSARTPGEPSDGWNVQGDVHLAQAGPRGAHCVLVARGDAAAHMLVDLDGEVPETLQKAAGLEKLVADRAIDAEMAIRIERSPRRTTVWYDTNNDGTFDRAFVDTDGDHRADAAFGRTAPGWSRADGQGEPILSTGHLAWLGGDVEKRTEAIGRLATLAGD